MTTEYDADVEIDTDCILFNYYYKCENKCKF